MTFSERYGFKKIKTLQVESMDEDLYASLWICLEELFDGLNQVTREFQNEQVTYRELLELIWTDFFKKPKGLLVEMNNYNVVHQAIKSYYDRLRFDEVYSLIEFVAKLLSVSQPKEIGNSFKNHCNHVLKRESAGWQFINDEICPLTTPYEIQSIEEAFDDVGEETSSHLRAMLRDFSQKGEKNYRGAATEAILAVEAFSREVTNEKSKILSALCSEGRLPLHKSLQKSLSQLYAFSNDEIRHAQKAGSDDINYELAKFMILQCTSYINQMKANIKGQIS